MLQLKSVSKTFEGTAALSRTDLEIPRGRTTVVVGPSGCGKSTVLRLFLGLIEPDQGHVELDGERLTPANVLSARRRMGYVIQEGGLFPHLTARDNVALIARHLGREPTWIEERIETLRALTRFPGGALDRFPSQLSGGQRQRVGLMRALILDPDVLLLDEPLGALDPMIRADLQTDLKKIFQTLEKTVVLVTHDLFEAGYLGHRIVLMRDGRIVQVGSLAEMIDRPAEEFVTRFVKAQRTDLGPGTGSNGSGDGGRS